MIEVSLDSESPFTVLVLVPQDKRVILELSVDNFMLLADIAMC